LLSHKVDSEKIQVVKNGFDPEVFTYAGPEGRDWHELLVLGRVEAPKGNHVLLKVFAELKIEFHDLKLSFFGDESFWPEFTSHKHDLMRKLPGLQFHGKVPQRELAHHLRRAGLLVFPSQTFETAGLAVAAPGLSCAGGLQDPAFDAAIAAGFGTPFTRHCALMQALYLTTGLALIFGYGVAASIHICRYGSVPFSYFSQPGLEFFGIHVPLLD
jgi:glycosyltransferase involved in cell wall biosynthesis